MIIIMIMINDALPGLQLPCHWQWSGDGLCNDDTINYDNDDDDVNDYDNDLLLCLWWRMWRGC